MVAQVDVAAQPATAAREGGVAAPLALGFGVGTVGVSILLQTVSVYFPVMMATVLGYSPAITGLIVMGAKLYDMAADVFIGSASDRTRSRWGRRRPYLFVGSIVGSLSFVALFNPLAGGGPTMLVLLALVLVIYSTGYSLFNVPYLAMPAEMTASYHERTRLLSFRTVFIAVGQMTALSGAAALVSYYGGGRLGFSRMGMVLGAVIFATTMISFLATGSARQAPPEPRKSSIPFGERIRLVLGNRPFVMLMAAKLCILFAVAATGGTMLLFQLNTLKIGYQGSLYMNIALNLALAASMPFWAWLSRRIGKRWAYIAAISIYIVAVSSWLLARRHEPMELVVLRGLVNGVGTGGMALLGLSMLPDTMEYDTRRTGLRREGVFSSIFAVAEKFAFAIGPSIVGFFLAASGYVATTHGRLVEQPASVAVALYSFVGVVAPSLALLGIVILLFYDLDERKLKSAGRLEPSAPSR